MEGSFLFKVFNAEWQSSRVAEVFRAACGRGIGVGRYFIKVFNAEWQSSRVAEVSRAACGSVIGAYCWRRVPSRPLCVSVRS